MTRSVADAALLLNILVGRDQLDNYTSVQPEASPDYTQALDKNGLRGIRIGVPRRLATNDTQVIAAFNASLDVLRTLGAIITDPADLPSTDELFSSRAEGLVATVDIKVRTLSVV